MPNLTTPIPPKLTGAAGDDIKAIKKMGDGAYWWAKLYFQ